MKYKMYVLNDKILKSYSEPHLMSFFDKINLLAKLERGQIQDIESNKLPKMSAQLKILSQN